MLYAVLLLLAVLITIITHLLVNARNRIRALETRLANYEAIRKDVAVLMCGSFSEKPFWAKEDEV